MSMDEQNLHELLIPEAKRERRMMVAHQTRKRNFSNQQRKSERKMMEIWNLLSAFSNLDHRAILGNRSLAGLIPLWSCFSSQSCATSMISPLPLLLSPRILPYMLSTRPWTFVERLTSMKMTLLSADNSPAKGMICEAHSRSLESFRTLSRVNHDW